MGLKKHFIRSLIDFFNTKLHWDVVGLYLNCQELKNRRCTQIAYLR